MTQYYLDADNGDDTHSGLNPTQSSAVSITSSDVNDQVLTAAVHGLTTGDFVNISGHSGSTPDINGANQQITVVDTTHFTIDGVDITVGGTGGTVQKEDGPFATLVPYTENARVAGDIGTLRRGTTATYDDATDLTHTSDGAIGNPIVIEADFDDVWSDFANSAQTFTPVFGSKTMQASATITGISVGDWIYNLTDGDDPRLYSYEVAAVSGTTLTLYLPFKGSTGSAKTLKVMPAAPVWGVLTSPIQWDINLDQWWKVQGLQATGSDVNGCIECDTEMGAELLDMVFLPDSGDSGCEITADAGAAFFKCRFKSASAGSGRGIAQNLTQDRTTFYAENCLFDGFLEGVQNMNGNSKLIDCEFANCTSNFAQVGIILHNAEVKLRNCVMGSPTNVVNDHADRANSAVLMEDYDGTPGSTRQYVGLADAQGSILLQSDTGTLRSGGNNISIKILPSTNMAQGSFYSKLLLFEIPIYATTASKTYQIYFKSNATANWTANPTAAELFIELEAWGHASNNFRKITKSTGTLSFTTLTTWNALSVTVAPAQAGVAYLRGWYMKPKESAKSNEFFIDPLPVIS